MRTTESASDVMTSLAFLLFVIGVVSPLLALAYMMAAGAGC